MPHFTFPQTLSSFELELQGRELIDTNYVKNRPDWIGGSISYLDAKFLSGLVQYLVPRKVAEIGVASGWSSAVLLKSMNATKHQDFELIEVDLFEVYFLDSSHKTGSAVRILEPDLVSHYRLITGAIALDSLRDIADLDLLFIDAHHMHPWATLDLLSGLHTLGKGCWVALHDLELCTLPRHNHRNRGPFYLYNFWQAPKINSTEVSSMIGAIYLKEEPETYLPLLEEILYVPWEIQIESDVVERLSGLISTKFGTDAGKRIFTVCQLQNTLPQN